MANARQTKALIIVDGQIDFMGHADGTPYTIPYAGGTYTAALPVAGAVEDMERLCDLIEAKGADYKAIFATLDSHQPLQIFHPGYWRDASGKPAEVDMGAGKFPFMIQPDDIRKGVWVPYNATLKYAGINPTDPSKAMTGYDWALYYTEQLVAAGKDPLTIWPNHCLIGTVGHGLYPRLARVLQAWAVKYGRSVTWKVKGSNPFTEHYGGLQAEVVIGAYHDTLMDMGLIQAMQAYDVIDIAGEASSHCVMNTVLQVVDGFGTAPLGGLRLLTDAMSPVGLPGYPERAKAFTAKMQGLGLQTATTAELIAA